MCVWHSQTNEPTNEEQRSLKMTAKQWAARAVMAAAMAAGLSACGGGGGGDSAAPPPPETLTAGLTIKESTGNAPAKGTYVVKIIDELPNALANAQGSNTTYLDALTYTFEENTQRPGIGGTISINKNDGSIIQALVYGFGLGVTPVACGLAAPSNPCSGLKVDLNTKTITITSVVLKAVTSDWSGLNVANPGQVTVSGIVTQ
ncbi:MAG: hypothetical protein RJB60_1257 [Pseudomonadota bacterium]